jgi:1-acyl-sn-glycerol-3-phosphate acyltransferase
MGNPYWYWTCKSLVAMAAEVAYGARYTGLENVPREGGVLMISNHQSHLDPPLIGSGCPRQMSFVARKSLFKFPPFGWFIHSLNAFPIDRDGFPLAGVKETLRRLKGGEMVLIFPEGTRTRTGEMGHFKPGFSALAVRARAAILPAAIEGSFAAWPRRQSLPSPGGNVHVHFGQPILPDEYMKYKEAELVATLEGRVRAYHEMLCRRAPFTGQHRIA